MSNPTLDAYTGPGSSLQNDTQPQGLPLTGQDVSLLLAPAVVLIALGFALRKLVRA